MREREREREREEEGEREGRRERGDPFLYSLKSDVLLFLLLLI
jgi:hypothetical protein